MSTRTVTLHDSGGVLLVTLLVRDADPATESPLRNYDGVQPPGSTEQGLFGDGIHKVGILERDFAMCNTDDYDSVFHAKAALDEALDSAASIRLNSAWELELAGVAGITEWQPQRANGLRARIRFIPSTAYWVSLTDSATTAVGLL